MPVNRADFLASLTLGTSAPSALSQATFNDQARSGKYRHHQVFAVQRVSNGAVFTSIANSLDAYEIAWAEGPGTLHAAVALYGNAVALAIDDEAWDAYRMRDILDAAHDPLVSPSRSTGNPFAAVGSPRSIGALQRRGVSFYVCNNALTGLARAAGRLTGRDARAAYDQLRRHLLSGCELVPAGVAVINALQEQHYTLYQSL